MLAVPAVLPDKTTTTMPWGVACLRSNLSLSLLYQLSAGESRFKISPAVLEISRNEPTGDRHTKIEKNDVLVYVPCIHTFAFNKKRLF